MNNKFLLGLPLILIIILAGIFSSFSASHVNAQIIGTLPIITIPISTATRTPTPINIGNFVWDDLDQDGRQDAGEPGLPNVIVQLWNSTKTQLIDSDSTDGSGLYSVIAPLPGDYRVRVVLPGILDTFSPKDQAGGDNNLDSDINPSGGDAGFTDIISIASNVISMSNVDAGIIKFRTPTATRTQTPINIGNFVWHDLDKDGIQDAGEPGVAGVTVQLWNSAKTSLIDSTVTNSNGIYSLIAPLPGDYRVRVIPFPGSAFSNKDQGADDTKDSDINDLFLVVNYGYTDIISIANNVISISNIDAGLSTVGATSTPTLGVIGTPSPTPQGAQSTPTPIFDDSNKIFLPLVIK